MAVPAPRRLSIALKFFAAQNYEAIITEGGCTSPFLPEKFFVLRVFVRGAFSHKGFCRVAFLRKGVCLRGFAS